MAEYLHPGVYVQEVPSAVKPIEGASTSTAAFVGLTDKGPVPGTLLPTGSPAYPGMITSFTDYTRRYGGFRTDSFLTYAVQAFFQNGGQRLYIVRVLPPPPTPTSPPGPTPAVASATIGAGGAALHISAANQGQWGNKIWIQIAPSSDGAANNFKLLVKYGATLAEAQGNVVEAYDFVTFLNSPTSLPGSLTPADYARTVVNARSEYIAITADFNGRPPNTPLGANSVPQRTPLVGGSDGLTANLNSSVFIGAPATSNTLTGTGLFALDKLTDVNLIAIPGQGDIATVNAGIAYCKNQRPLQDCFFVGDIGRMVNGVPSARRMTRSGRRHSGPARASRPAV